MSNNNNKNYHNYQNYQNKKNHNNNNNSKVEETKAPVKEEAKVAEQEAAQEEVIHSIMDDYEANALAEEQKAEESKVEETKTITGVVVDCPRLRVRAAANKNAEVLCEINVDSKVLISEKESTNEFYKVCTEAGVEGYCMKQFIGIE